MLQNAPDGLLTRQILRFRTPLFIVASIITACCVLPASRLKLDRSVESLFAADNSHLLRFQQSKARFGGDEFVIVAYEDQNLFPTAEPVLSPASEQRIEQLVADLNAIPGVLAKSTNDLADSLKFKYRRHSARTMLEGVLVSADYQVTAIVLLLQESSRAPILRAETIARIRQVAAAQPTETFVVGEPVQVHDMFEYVEEDGRMLWAASLVLLSIVILICLRSLRWMALPLLAVVCSIVWTNAILYVLDLKLSMVSSMLNSLVTIVGTATTMHIAVCYLELRTQKPAIDALRETFRLLSAPVLWSFATTAIGFGTLLISQIKPVFSFGIMMVIALLFLLIAFICLFPGGIVWGDRLPTRARTARLSHWLVTTLELTRRWPGTVGWTAVAVVALAIVGFQRIEIETDFSRNFHESSPIIQSLNFVESRLGGAGNWEVGFPAPTEPSQEFYDRVRKVADRLRELEIDGQKPLTKVVAVTDGLDLIPNVPLLMNSQERKLLILDEFQPDFSKRLYNRDKGYMRIVLRSLEKQQSSRKIEAINRVEQLVRDEFPEAQTTGLYVLLAYVTQSLLQDQLLSFTLAIAAIGGMLCLVFRSLKFGLVALVPNVFPIIFVLGMMGWLGWRINIATAMMACISLGLTIDDSIHYLSRYQRCRRDGQLVADAIASSHAHTGRALVLSTLALIAGFSTLTLSNFIPLIDFAILVSFALFGGLIGNLILLPTLIPLADRDQEPTST